MAVMKKKTETILALFNGICQFNSTIQIIVIEEGFK